MYNKASLKKASNIKEDTNILVYQEWEETQHNIIDLSLRLTSEIKEPNFYDKMLSRIINLTEHDAVIIYLDTVGGSLDGAIAIVDAIRRTKAQVHMSITGKAYSAGSAILMWADSVDISPYARVMIHAYRGGFFGKTNELESEFDFENKYYCDFLVESYSGFLNKKEIDSVLKGSDVYITASDIEARLKKRFDYRQKNIIEYKNEK